MVTVWRIVLTTVGLIALQCLPLVLVLLRRRNGSGAGTGGPSVTADRQRRSGQPYPAGRRERSWRRAEARTAAQLAQAQAASSQPSGPPIERITADLHRLHRQRSGVARQSLVWACAVREAYDEHLQQACRALNVPEYLGELHGFDRDIERIRVEGALQEAGLDLLAVEEPTR